MVAGGNDKGEASGGRQKRMGPATPLVYQPASGKTDVGPVGVLSRVPALMRAPEHTSTPIDTIAHCTDVLARPDRDAELKALLQPVLEVPNLHLGLGYIEHDRLAERDHGSVRLLSPHAVHRCTASCMHGAASKKAARVPDGPLHGARLQADGHI